jgi:hypothetical protein
MPKCYRCKTEFGSFETKIQKMADGRLERFCSICAPLWDLEIKNRWIAYLSQGNNLTTTFVIPRTLTADPIERSKSLMGHLLFTNKAVVFAQFESMKMSSASFSDAVVFGAILGSVVAAKRHKKNLKKALSGMSEPEEVHDQQETMKILNESSNLIVLPKGSITALKNKGGQAVDVQSGSFSTVFSFEGKKNEVYRKFEQQLTNYLSSSSVSANSNSVSASSAMPKQLNVQPSDEKNKPGNQQLTTPQLYCGSCGAELKSNVKFCGKCGKKMP